MPAQLITAPPFLPPDGVPRSRVVELCRHSGLSQVTAGGCIKPLAPAQLDELGLDDTLRDQARCWSETYTAFGARLPKWYVPEDCVEFEIESHNAQGLCIAEAAALALDETYCVIFRALGRTRYLHLSLLLQFRDYPLQVPPQRHAQWGDGKAVMPPPSPPDDDGFAGRWVRFMFDHCSSCLWNAWGEEDGVELLPLDPATAGQLEAEIEALRLRWEDWDFADSLRPHYTPAFIAEREAFARAGLDLARKLKAALPSDWTVVYFDIDRAARSRLRHEFEYAV